MYSSPKNKNYVIIYSSSRCVKPKRLYFIFDTQIKIFLMTPEWFLSLNWKSIPPKINKDIEKWIHINQAVYSKSSEVAQLLYMINVVFYSQINLG